MGNEYRLLVVDGQVVAASHIRAPNVVGDGRATIDELIRRKNEVRAKNPYVGSHLIPSDPSLLDALDIAGRGLGSIPEADECVSLRTDSRISAGADVVDVTDQLDTQYEGIAIEAVKSLPGVSYAEVRIMAGSLRSDRSGKSTHPVITHVDCFLSAIGRFPTHGRQQDIAGAVIEHYLSLPRWKKAQKTSQTSHVK